jgi:hypothetical protein
MVLEKWLGRAIVASVAVFVVLVATAMALYPGGHSWDPHASGHDLWRNYLCDLARTTALDGRPNRGAFVGKLALIVLALGLVPFFARTTDLARELRGLGRVVRLAAVATATTVPAVAFVSGDRYGRLHALAVVVAGVPGLFAGAGAVVALTLDRRAPRAVTWVGIVALGLGTVDFALYVANLHAEGGGPVAVAVLERLTSGALLAWMLLAARAAPPDAPQHAASSPRAVTRQSRPAVALDPDRNVA